MSARPTDWSPLAGSDPTPGDPDAVLALANRYRDTALEIERQARLLKTLSAADGWESEAGEVFAEEAGELAGKLAKVHGRYAKVNMQLRRWSPALRDAQCEADAALAQAKEAEARQQANDSSLLDGVDEPTPEQEAAERRRQAAYDGAGDALAAARRRLDQAVDSLDRTAGQVSSAIRDASDDDVKDSLWDKVKGIISDHAKILNIIAEVASYLALALTVVVIVMVTAPAWVFLAAVGLTLLALTLKTALAAAGKVSWLDALIEALSLFGLLKGAKLATKAAKAVAATRGAAARHAGSQAANTVLRGHRVSLRAAGWAMRTRVPLGPLRGVALSHIRTVRAAAETARAAAEAAVWRAPLVRPGLWQKFTHLDGRLAMHAGDATRLARTYATSPEVVAAAARATKAIRATRAVTIPPTIIDIADKAGAFEPIKPYFTREIRPLGW